MPSPLLRFLYRLPSQGHTVINIIERSLTMPHPDPRLPNPYDALRQPIPAQTWANGELAVYLTEVEKSAFLHDTNIDPYSPL